MENLIAGRDGLVRAAILRAGKSYLERPVQLLYPLELSCDRATKEPEKAKLNPDAATFKQSEILGLLPRPEYARSQTMNRNIELNLNLKLYMHI